MIVVSSCSIFELDNDDTRYNETSKDMTWCENGRPIVKTSLTTAYDITNEVYLLVIENVSNDTIYFEYATLANRIGQTVDIDAYIVDNKKLYINYLNPKDVYLCNDY